MYKASKPTNCIGAPVLVTERKLFYSELSIWANLLVQYIVVHTVHAAMTEVQHIVASPEFDVVSGQCCACKTLCCDFAAIVQAVMGVVCLAKCSQIHLLFRLSVMEHKLVFQQVTRFDGSDLMHGDLLQKHCEVITGTILCTFSTS